MCKLETKTELAWNFRRTGNAYGGSAIACSSRRGHFLIDQYCRRGFRCWLLGIGEDDLIGIVRVDLEWIVVNDLEIESAYTVLDQVVGGSEDLLIDVGEVEEKPTACQTFAPIVDERELDDPVIDNIEV